MNKKPFKFMVNDAKIEIIIIIIIWNATLLLHCICIQGPC